MNADLSLVQHFQAILTRLQSACQTPVALYGAGKLVRQLSPLCNAPAGLITCIIDDSASRQGRMHCGLPVVSLEHAHASGVRAVVITAEGAGQDAIWSRRGKLRERGLYVLTCPQRFTSMPWDDCLIEQREASMAIETGGEGAKPVYDRTYPKLDHRASPGLIELYQRAIPKDGTVLEVGPGTGMLTESLLATCGQYWAVDFSERLLFESIEHRFSQHLSRMHLIADRSASFPGVPDSSIDLIASYDVFVHIKVDVVHQYFGAIRRVLRPGGKALIHFIKWEPDTIATFERNDLPAYCGKPNYFEYLHEDQLKHSAERWELGLKTFRHADAHSWWFMELSR